MKNIISFAFVLIIITVLIMNMALFFSYSAVEKRVNNVVYSAVSRARQQGMFTNEIINQINTELNNLGIEPADVNMSLTTTPQYRQSSFDNNELIEWEISIFYPIFIETKHAMKFKGSAASELLE